MKWSVHKTRCRHNFRDCCRPTWVATPPGEDSFGYEFDTWDKAINFVHQELAGV